MRFADIVNGKVVNIVESVEQLKPNWVQSDTAKKGDIYENGEFSDPVESTATLYDEKETEIIAEFDAAVKKSLGNYTQHEIDSWYKQEKEAKAFADDANSSTPLLDAIASARGSTRRHLAGQIIDKANAFEVVYGGILGKKQKLLDQLYVIDINSPTAQAEIESIVW